MSKYRCFFCGKFMKVTTAIDDDVPCHNKCFTKAFRDEWGDRYDNDDGSFNTAKWEKDHIIYVDIPNI